MINLRWKVTASIVAVLALFLLARLEALQVATTTPQAITTYHYDNLRTVGIPMKRCSHRGTSIAQLSACGTQ